ncbi:MAG: tripartite tricarboxylate transporter substrate binding protein [Betaproteobacteria bacterium]|nr:tripartite tricarboxylate transporter substrate binding protein [Betaproteobacteria bacterium]
MVALRRVALVAVLGCAAIYAEAASSAGRDSAGTDGYPNKPVRLVAPFVPGGPTDIVARVVAQKLGQNIGQTVVVDNRGGAGGAIGCEIVARSAPDGYTLMIGSSGNLAVAPALFARLPYDPAQDFQPITQTTAGPQIVVVNPSLAAKSIQDLIAMARANPGGLNYASGGAGTTTQLGPELFKSMAGVDIVHVPYKGTGQALTDVLSGQVQMMMSSLLPAIPHVKSGKLRGLAVTSLKRSAALPDIPTVAESGVPGFETTSWHGMVVPARTPKAIIARLHAEMVKMLNQPEVKALFLNQGMEIVGNSPDEFAAYIRHETEKWTKVIKTIGLKPQ